MLKVIVLTALATIGIIVFLAELADKIENKKEEKEAEEVITIRPEIEAEIEKLANAKLTNEQLLNLSNYVLGRDYLFAGTRLIANLPDKITGLNLGEKALINGTVRCMFMRRFEELDEQDKTISNYYS